MSASTKSSRRERGRSTRDAHQGAPTRDPRGGLTAAGRRAFKRKEGANLKPAVKKSSRDMSLAEMHRNGSWAARFYARQTLAPLLDDYGMPTRFALTAAAWGEPVPRTPGAVRKNAAKGRRLLAQAKRAKVSA